MRYSISWVEKESMILLSCLGPYMNAVSELLTLCSAIDLTPAELCDPANTFTTLVEDACKLALDPIELRLSSGSEIWVFILSLAGTFSSGYLISTGLSSNSIISSIDL